MNIHQLIMGELANNKVRNGKLRFKDMAARTGEWEVISYFSIHGGISCPANMYTSDHWCDSVLLNLFVND